MGRRRGARDTGPGGKAKDLPDYYAKSDSDVAYSRKSHERARQQGLRQWVTRLVVVLALVAAWHFWGPMAVRIVRGEGRQTVSDFKGVGRNLQEGRDRRSGVGLDESP